MLILWKKNKKNTYISAGKAKNQKHILRHIIYLILSCVTERIDNFWFSMLSFESIPCDDAVVIIIKVVMILSHGNSNIEGSFFC